MPEVMHQRCVWHLQKNLKKNIPDAAELFNEAYLTTSEDIFETIWAQVQDTATTEKGKRYIDELYGCRDQWAKCWTQKYRNLGIQSTQRAESGHSSFKYLMNKTLSLTEMLSHLQQWRKLWLKSSQMKEFDLQWRQFPFAANPLFLLFPSLSVGAAWRIADAVATTFKGPHTGPHPE